MGAVVCAKCADECEKKGVSGRFVTGKSKCLKIGTSEDRRKKPRQAVGAGWGELNTKHDSTGKL